MLQVIFIAAFTLFYFTCADPFTCTLSVDNNLRVIFPVRHSLSASVTFLRLWVWMATSVGGSARIIW